MKLSEKKLRKVIRKEIKTVLNEGPRGAEEIMEELRYTVEDLTSIAETLVRLKERGKLTKYVFDDPQKGEMLANQINHLKRTIQEISRK